MTKLEEKLKELGYRKLKTIHNDFGKEFNDYINKYIYCDLYSEKINDFEVKPFADINDQSILNDLQQAFDEMQKDLEELRKYEI